MLWLGLEADEIITFYIETLWLDTQYIIGM